MNEMPINEKIMFPRFTLILEDGVNKGEVSKFEALNIARAAGLDLVMVSAGDGEKKPTCRIMDYGKVKYQQAKNERHNQKHGLELKELRLFTNTGEQEVNMKLKQAEEFLKKGHRVRFNLSTNPKHPWEKRLFRHQAAAKQLATIVSDLKSRYAADDVSVNPKAVSIMLLPTEKKP